jgi:beta-galactosidase
VNFGAHTEDRKGITNHILIGGTTIFDWKVFTLPFDSEDLSRLSWRDVVEPDARPLNPNSDFDHSKVSPTFFKGTIVYSTSASSFSFFRICSSYNNQKTKGSFLVKKAEDSFVKLTGYRQGSVFVNGFNLGRHWFVGPQQTLYLPASLLKMGENEIIVFEAYYRDTYSRIEITDHQTLDQKVNTKIT